MQSWPNSTSSKWIGLLVLASPLIVAPVETVQQPPCEFSLSEPTVKQTTISGNEGVNVPVRVMHQPDSPVEILSVDLTGYVLDVQRGSDGIYRYSHSDRCKVRVRNRGSLPISDFEVSVGGSGLIWTRTSASPFKPGQEVELGRCGGGGSGHGPQPPEMVVLVARVEFDGCSYIPSQRHSKLQRRAIHR